MNCRTARKLVQERHDGVLPAERGTVLQEHLHGCSTCSRLAGQFELAQQWLRDLPLEQPSDNFEWRLKLRLSQAEREFSPALPVGSSPSRRIWTFQFAVSTAVAALLVLATGLVLGLRNQGVPDSSVQGVASAPQWAPGSNAAARTGWPRLVPVRSGAPLGPELEANAGPSILGNAHPDTTFLEDRRPDAPLRVTPVRY